MRCFMFLQNTNIKLDNIETQFFFPRTNSWSLTNEPLASLGERTILGKFCIDIFWLNELVICATTMHVCWIWFWNSVGNSMGFDYVLICVFGAYFYSSPIFRTLHIELSTVKNQHESMRVLLKLMMRKIPCHMFHICAFLSCRSHASIWYVSSNFYVSP